MNHTPIRVGLFTLFVLGWAAVSMADEEPYPKSELLVEPALLADDFIILDARGRSEYEAGHVPGARWVDHAAWSKAVGSDDDAAWAGRIGSLGIRPDSRVIVYDDAMTKDAARIWWVLRYRGVEDVRLLNGGWVGWKADGRPTEKNEPSFEPVEFAADPRPARMATKDQLLGSLDGNRLQIVDARSEGEFCGTEALSNRRGGAVPGAKNLEWSDLIDHETHRFKPADELRTMFEEAGIRLDRPTATHCQSGGRASVMAFGLELMGADRVSNYYPGWGEWGNAEDTPVEPGKPKR